jgi:hypothetical protein
MKDICVVHLVRNCNDPALFEQFIDSYKRHPAGVEHDIAIAAKGYDSPLDLNGSGILPDGKSSLFSMRDIGFDITAYHAVVEQYAQDYRYFCFLNSYSQIQDDFWLQKIYQTITLPNVGLVGCTGSWESAPNLPAFPNYHIRTNAFMIEGEDFLSCGTTPATKEECNAFEAGENSLTRQLVAKGKECLVVGKGGTGIDKEHWNLSNTFRQGEQENLMVSDNRTDHYQYADLMTRDYLRKLAWG